MLELDAAIKETVASYRRILAERDLTISPDGRVTEPTAAMLLRISPSGLRKMREQDRGPRSRRLPLDNHSITYRLIDLAMWTEQR